MLRTMSVREVARSLGVSRGVIDRALIEPVFEGFAEGVELD
jgi:hypothetical protein